MKTYNIRYIGNSPRGQPTPQGTVSQTAEPVTAATVEPCCRQDESRRDRHTTNR
jgi:hypothetical protein